MEFNWTTFALEILNFLVLLWILKRFLYLPVKNVLAQRKAAINDSVEQAHFMQATADDLKRQYEGRMASWESERAQARVQLADEISAERSRLLAEVHQAIEQERDKERALEQRRAVELRQLITHEAVREAAGFAARVLTRLAGPELEKRISEVAIEDLRGLPDEQIGVLREACLSDKARITSAYALPTDVCADLTAALSSIAGGAVDCEFAQDGGLIAGLRISVGAWLLRCNLADELAFFAETRDARAT